MGSHSVNNSTNSTTFVAKFLLCFFQYRAAYNVLQNMRREGVAADSKTVSTIVFGCLKGRMHAQAVEVVLNVSRHARLPYSPVRALHCALARIDGLTFSTRALS